MSRALRARLFATQVMLNDATSEAALGLSKMQHEAVQDLLLRERESYSSALRSEIAEKLTVIKWQSDHRQALLGTLMYTPDDSHKRRWQS